MLSKGATVVEIKHYFQEKLASHFSDREVKFIVKTILCRRLNYSSIDLLTRNDAIISLSDIQYFQKVIDRLLEGEPFQYIAETTFFYNIDLKIDKRALIPRPETEELVDWIVSDFKNKKSLHILDVGTGSGCISLALKNEMPNWKITGIDISKEAISLAQANAKCLNLVVDFHQLDVFEIEKTELKKLKFDVIVSNPPYIPKSDESKMKNHVLHHEPQQALFVGDEDPLIFYKKIASIAKLQLNDEGTLYLEINEDLGEATIDLLKKMGFKNCQLRQDLQGKDRMIRAKKE